jgi:AcrR family transcriptional regulator
MIVSIHEDSTSGSIKLAVTKPEGTRARIIRKGLKLFAEKGYEAATMNDIASAVGIKAASLYAHYRGKEELFKAVFESALETWADLVDGIFARASSVMDLQTRLESILGDFAVAMMDSVAYRFWARVYVFPPPLLDAEDRARLVAMDRSFAARLSAFCDSLLPSSIPREDIELLGSSLAFFVMGILMYVELLDEKALRGEIRRGVAFHLKALRAD